MSEQPVVVNKISWSDLCPWTIIFKTLPVAASVSVMAFAILGVVLTPMGWMLSESLFVHQAQRDDPMLMEFADLNSSPYRSVFLATQEGANSIEVLGAKLNGPRLVFHQMIKPFQNLFDGTWGTWEFFYFLFGGIWSMLVWSFVGLAICRICLLKLTRGEQAGLDDAFDFVLDPAGGEEARYPNWVSAIGAVGIPLLAVAVLCVPAFLIGLMMSFNFGVAVVSVFWFVVLALAAAMTLLLLGLMFGWPLMISSVAAESQNSFDAMTRAYAYTFQRPVNYLFYMVIAILFGGFCWLVVASLTDGILNMAYWSTSWGANVSNGDRIDILIENPLLADVKQVGDTAEEVASNQSSTLWFGRSLMGLWNSLLRTIAAAFIYGLFWCMASAIYLLLRKDVDETEMDEVFLFEEKRTYELPPLKSDDNGIPQVQTLVAVEDTVTDEADEGNENPGS